MAKYYGITPAAVASFSTVLAKIPHMYEDVVTQFALCYGILASGILLKTAQNLEQYVEGIRGEECVS